jgi:hypothetical protein
MDVFVHCCSRTNVERFVMKVVDEQTLNILIRLSETPSVMFCPSGGQGCFRIFEIEQYPDGIHIFALRAVPLH